MITIGMTLCEPGYSPGSNCNVHSIFKMKEKKKNQDVWDRPTRTYKNDSFYCTINGIISRGWENGLWII